MHFEFRNTNHAGVGIYRWFQPPWDNRTTGFTRILQASSRNGDVLRAEHPVSVLYDRPMERVNLWPARDANPFFHLFEAIWMMAGRRDTKFLTQFVPRMQQFSDDGSTLNGAYGYRLRMYSRMNNSLRCAATELEKDPTSRRAYVTLWYPDDTGAVSKDLPCNVGAHFQIVYDQLCMTVFNRSNDVVWGGVTGANIVHFSVFQEYVAALLRRPMGWLSVVSSNFHMYLNDQGKTLLKEADELDEYDAWWFDAYPNEVVPTTIISSPETFPLEAQRWTANPSTLDTSFKNPVFNELLMPLYLVHRVFKAKGAEAAYWELRARCPSDTAPYFDWQLAVREWLLRRIGKGM